MLKVLHFIPGFLYGGIESLYLEWYKQIDHNKIDFQLLLRTQDDNALALCQYRKMNGKYYRLANKKNLLKYCISINAFFKKHHDYDLIHSHGADPFVLAAAKKYGIKTIVHSHTSQLIGSHITAGNVFYIIESWVAKRLFTDYGFACSKKAANWMFKNGKFKGKNVIIVHNAIDSLKYVFDNNKRIMIRENLGIDDAIVIGHVGRMTYAKNQFYLLEIFKEIHEENDKFRLLFVGEGPLEEDLKRYADDLGISDYILFLGTRDDVADLMQAMDLFLLPSRYEGLPVTLIEAQAAGLPCVISDAISEEADISDLIYRQSINSKPEKWKKTINTAGKIPRKDTSSVIIKNGFDMETEVRKLIGVYKTILASRI